MKGSEYLTVKHSYPMEGVNIQWYDIFTPWGGVNIWYYNILTLGNGVDI